MDELESYGTEQNRKVYRRHGAEDNHFGVSFANLYKLQKRLKVHQELAVQLWETGNTDAMTLATLIVGPKQFDEATLEKWLMGLSYYMLVDLYARNIVAKSDHADVLMDKWIQTDEEWVARAGWEIMAQKAMSADEIDDDYFIGVLDLIEFNIHQAKNRTRHSMNGALIAIGLRNDARHDAAVKSAEVIGKVEVDHGDTSCKTPEAIPYMEKGWARKNKKRVSRKG